MASLLCFAVRTLLRAEYAARARVGVVLLCLMAVTLPLSAGLEQGLAAYREGNFTKALEQFRVAAESGEATAMFSLGFMYLRGEGVPVNHSEAARWLEMAAELGVAPAQHSLALLYYEGLGVTRNTSVAANYFESAALQGLADAQYNLGILYSRGDGVKQDWALARFWHQKAADQGVTDAQLALGVMAANGHGARQDYEEAARWFGQAAAAGNTRARRMLETAFSDLQADLPAPEEVDSHDSGQPFQKAPPGGPDPSLADGRETGPPPNPSAPEDTDSSSENRRPTRYWNHPPAEIDEAAFRSLQGLAVAGDAEAQVSLAWHYLYGVSAPESLVRSYVWAERAARKGSQDGAAMADAIRGRLGPRQRSATEAILRSAPR